MADGGILPWRRQRPDGMIYCTYEDLFKPLPPPPPGKMWKKVRLTAEEQEAQDGATTRWELVEKRRRAAPPGAADGQGGDDGQQLQRDGQEEEEELGEAAFIEHVVLPTDTMAGLRLRYKVTAAELRKHNDFFGDRFQLCEVLRIPVKGREPHILKNRQKPTPELLRQQFKVATKCHDDQAVTYYLEVNDWDLSHAVADCEDDRLWEEQQRAARKRGSRAPAVVPPTRAAYEPPQPVLPTRPSGPPPAYRSLFSIDGAAALRQKQQQPGKPKPPPPPVAMTDVVSASSSSSSSSPARPPSAVLTARVCYDDQDDQRQPLLATVAVGGGDVAHPRAGRSLFRFV